MDQFELESKQFPHDNFGYYLTWLANGSLATSKVPIEVPIEAQGLPGCEETDGPNDPQNGVEDPIYVILIELYLQARVQLKDDTYADTIADAFLYRLRLDTADACKFNREHCGLLGSSIINLVYMNIESTRPLATMIVRAYVCASTQQAFRTMVKKAANHDFTRIFAT